MKYFYIYSIAYIVSVISCLIYRYITVQEGTGITLEDFGVCLAASFFWPLVAIALPLEFIKYLVEKNDGYVIKKPSKKDKFKDQLGKFIK